MEALEILTIDYWQSIFNHLDDDALKAVSMVCKDFLTISNNFKVRLQVNHPEVGMLSKHLKRFKQLKKITLSQFRGRDLHDAIAEIGRSDVNLDVLVVTTDWDYKFNADCLEELNSNPNMKNLKALTCKGVHSFRDNHLVVIANLFPNLEKLKFGHNYGSEFILASDYGVEFLASKLTFLKKIHMFGIYCVSDRSLATLSSNCASLKSVTISCYANGVTENGVTENGIGLLLRNRPNLEALSLGFIKLGSSPSSITIENSISYAKSLKSLKFINMYVPDMILNAIGKAKLPLKKLVLDHCDGFAVTSLLMVLSNGLTKLLIPGCRIVDDDMKLLLEGDLSNLTHIDISQLLVSEPFFFRLLTKCPSLVEMSMIGAKIFYRQEFDDGNSIISLSRNHNMLNLYLPFSHITDESVKQFVLPFPNLRVLDLSDCQDLTSKGIEVILKSCKFIRKLSLEGYREAKLIEDNSEFPEMINLDSLSLFLSFIEDEGLSAIAEKCPRLVSLNLRCCRRVTMEGIKHIIKNIKTLSRIYFDTPKHNPLDLLEWMLATGNIASLKKIHIPLDFVKEEHQKEFLRHGLVLVGS